LWASQLILRADDLLAQGQGTWAQALHAADLGLCAAVSRTLRWRLWARYGACLAWSPEPERVRRTYDSFVCREFPTCSWEAFTEEFGTLCETLRARGPRQSAPPGNATAGQDVGAYWRDFWHGLVLAA